MTEKRIPINLVVENQLPEFVKEEFPLVKEFLSQYYISLENQGGTNDLVQNLDRYVKLDSLTNLQDSTTISQNVGFFDTTINVKSTAGFPEKYGLIQIDNEIITYTGKTSNSFTGCIRGFSGIKSLKSPLSSDELVFSTSSVEEHSASESNPNTVKNLSILFLKQFFIKLKTQIAPGFEERSLFTGLNQNLFIKQSKDFYSSKGTDSSFKILFFALYGQNVEVIRPRDFLIQPSDAQYRVTRDLVVESISGDPLQLLNCTIQQDNDSYFLYARGTVSEVEKIRRNDSDYYVISLDYDYDKDINVSGSVSGSFSIHPQTKTTSKILSGQDTLDVDSTVGFPESGVLIAELSNGTSLSIEYSSKSLNQFYNCQGITQNIDAGQNLRLNSYVYGIGNNGEEVQIRVTGVLSNLNILDDTRLYEKDDEILVKTLGYDLSDIKSNNWFYNIGVEYKVRQIQLLDSSDYTYRIFLYDDHILIPGDSITLTSSVGSNSIATIISEGEVISFENKKVFTIRGQGELDSSLSYIVTKNISKANAENYPNVNKYTTNVQNVYYDLEDSIYVASTSLPSYTNQALTVSDNSVTFSGSFSGTEMTIGFHGFYTGDSVIYDPGTTNQTLTEGIYFVERVDERTVRLARSRNNIYTNNYVDVTGSVSGATLKLKKFAKEDLSDNRLENQKIIRKISNPENSFETEETSPGQIGIFVNGVEILNYKSRDQIFYGPIQEIIPTSGGSGYDIINPPALTISDQVGSGASAVCSVIGGLERVDIIDPGFDYLEEPVITITGGNGNNAKAKANLVAFDHQVSFNSIESASLVDLTNNTISFSEFHKFRNAEKIVYNTNSETSVGGLSTSTFYFASIQDAYTIKLHNTFADAVSGINTVNLTSYGTGSHTFKSYDPKKKINSISVIDSGSNYQNKKLTTTSSGINTASNTITIQNHGYKSGEIVVYNSTEINVGGLSTDSKYYVTVVDQNKFKLSIVGTSSTISIGNTVVGLTTVANFYYKTKQYVNLVSVGSGLHEFNYEPITLTVSGRIGVSTLTQQDFNAILTPVFRGQVNSVSIQNNGSEYGSEEILNYNRQPQFILSSGAGAQVQPIISNGKITEVIVISPGTGYNSQPNIEINGIGRGALLSPVVSNGQLISVKVISGGLGYSPESTSINIIAAGQGAKFECNIKSWRINLVERAITTGQITDDDGFIETSINQKYELQYTHSYAPRKLRSSVLATRFKDGNITYVSDLRVVDGKEVSPQAHSPIIGWAYDGNPIYGPYAYSSPTGGSIRSMVSGYTLKETVNRPSLSIFPLGHFIEDYTFENIGDLDENNGRYCVTPEFPNGVYAYFCTISNGFQETTGPFANYFRPVFPYIIGNSYKSSTIPFNFLKSSNQDDIDLNQTNWVRNTTPYGLNKSNTTYNFLLQPNKIRSQKSIVKYAQPAGISSIGINSSGQNYQINDKIIFDSSNTGNGKGIFARVSAVSGKDVNNISVATTVVTNVEFIPSFPQGRFIAFSNQPHGFTYNDPIVISGLSTFTNFPFVASKAGIQSNTFTLTTGIGSTAVTGIITYFNISGFQYYDQNVIGNIRENDILEVNGEKVKVLLIDRDSSRIKVLREQYGTVGISHTIYSKLKEVPRKVYLNLTGVQINDSRNLSKFNKELYFDPKESLALGSTGIGTTITFSNPGVGITQVFNPLRSIYLPSHNLDTGSELIYSSNGGSPISVSTDGSSQFTLTESSIIYSVRLSNDLIGISTIRTGFSTDGTIVGIGTSSADILYFSNIGSGVNHSFKTNYSTIQGQISKNTVTVSTASTHGLFITNPVDVDVKVAISTTFKVYYNDYNRRLAINVKSFDPANVNVAENSISIANHGFYSGEKVIHVSTSPSGGLENNKIYYVINVDNNKIKLSESLFEITQINPNVVDITSASFGSLYKINPQVFLTKNRNTIFDLSDSSLSYIRNSIRYSAFDFNLYTDPQFKNIFYSTSQSPTFNVSKTGQIGITSDAKLTIRVTDDIPKILYYKLVPVDLDVNQQTKKEIIVDEDVVNNSKVVVSDSIYSGSFSISGVGTNYFQYQILPTPEYANEEYSYNSQQAQISYTVRVPQAYGGISEIEIKSFGNNYHNLPGISSIKSSIGENAVLEILTDDVKIGSIKTTTIQDIGFDYSSDKTVRPLAKLPDLLKIDPLSSFESIGVTSIGKNYTISPDLVVIDNYDNSVVDDVDLEYNIGDSEVTILKNTYGIYNVIPSIIPINNTNGVGISTISFNQSTKDVVVTLGSSFSSINDFPFSVGDRVLIENISVGSGSTYKGYNSENYNYSLFTITSIDPNIGGIGATVAYNISNYLASGEEPGLYDPVNSSGIIVPEKYFPVFEPKLKINDFIIGETVTSGSSVGIVETWDSRNQILKVSNLDNFVKGEIIEGKTSNSKGLVLKVDSFRSIYDIDSSSVVTKGWKTETGFLNNSIQRIHDNDYYQYFSYSLKSKVPYDTWNDAVSTLNHTSGFKKFSDLIIENTNSLGIGETQNNGDFTAISDLYREIDLNCVNDFDLASENNIIIDNKIKSNQIIFGSQYLQDYIESVGNRVLVIDDISKDFSSNPRPTPYEIVDIFDISERSKKYVIFIQDSRFTDIREVLFVTLIHDNSFAYLNQYGRVDSFDDLGYFDCNFFGTEGRLIYYPKYSEINDYSINNISFDIRDGVSGIGSTDLGNIVDISTETSNILSGVSTATNVVSIGTSYRASKILLEISATDNSYHEMDEITVIHDGSNVQIINYGTLSTDNLQSFSSVGFGTYNSYISGSELKIDLIPNTTTTKNYKVDSIKVSIGDTTSVGVGTITFNNSKLESNKVSIASSTSPIENQISLYTNTYSGTYCVVVVEDITNNEYQVSEIITLSNSTDSFFTEFGVISTNGSLGTFNTNLVGSDTELTFTPIANIDVEVRVFELSIGLTDDTIGINEIDMNNGIIKSSIGYYEGTQIDVKRAFNLFHKGNPIFERYFFGDDSSIVDISSNEITIPNHFFVSGEEVKYYHAGAGTTQAVGIATTSITGIGLTDKLPPTLYIIKKDDLKVQVAASASEALSIIPTPLTLSSVGIGTSHRFVSTNQNSKVLLSIDNMIQSPVVATSITTTAAKAIALTDTRITFSGITSFFGGDLIKVNDEIMRINSVGFGSTNVVFVQRFWMGTNVQSHSIGSLITKVSGNYNIVDNTVNFVTAPYGPTPIGTTTNRPDERDYVGIETHSTFSGRVFTRNASIGSTQDVYQTNYIFDNISSQFNGISTDFKLKSNGFDVTGFSTSNSIILINDIFQGPQRLGSVNILGDYYLEESSGITSIFFTGSGISTVSDVNTSNIPSGGILASVGSTEGLGYQPLVSAGGTAIVSVAGTIQSISIGNSGSGYREGIQTIVNVGVKTESTGTPNIEFIGTAAVSGGHIVSVAITNPGTGYTSTNPPIVVFDDPLSYSNIPLIYSSSSTSGVGTGARVDIVVGQGSSVINFEIKNSGYGYGQGEILTVAAGGLTGIPTDTSSIFKEFQIFVDKVDGDDFTGWVIGDLQVIDPIESLFDGGRRTFPIKINNNQTTLRAKPGSNIDIEASLLVFINDILQVPKISYTFKGGSVITFIEAPKVGDTCKIIFYRGTGGVDTIDVDVLETIKVGDNVRLNSDISTLKQDERVVNQIISSDVIETNVYPGPGITNDETLLRPVIWCRQTEDKIINGKEVAKDRVLYEPVINPTSNIIENVSTASTQIFVESVKTFFDSNDEYLQDGTSERPQKKIIIISQDELVSAAATAVVSVAGTISSIEISNSGMGYTFTDVPEVIIGNPVGLGTTQRATATALVSSAGIVTSIVINNVGSGYTTSNPPVVLIEPPTPTTEVIESVTYNGDFGNIVGYGISTIGGSDKNIFDFYIPQNSFLRDTEVVGTAITISQIDVGDFFVVQNSNVGVATTNFFTYRTDGSIIGLSTHYVDGIYQVDSVETIYKDLVGIGSTYVRRVFAVVEPTTGISTIGLGSSTIFFDSTYYTWDYLGITTYAGGMISTSNYFGEFSWGRISNFTRINPQEFECYGFNGISTSPSVIRFNPLKFKNYVN